MFIGDLPAKDNPRKILKNCSSAKLNSYEISKSCCSQNQTCAKNNPLKVVRPYNSPTGHIPSSKLTIETPEQDVKYASIAPMASFWYLYC